jgi:hypothetical protein
MLQQGFFLSLAAAPSVSSTRQNKANWGYTCIIRIIVEFYRDLSKNA